MRYVISFLLTAMTCMNCFSARLVDTDYLTNYVTSVVSDALNFNNGNTVQDSNIKTNGNGTITVDSVEFVDGSITNVSKTFRVRASLSWMTNLACVVESSSYELVPSGTVFSCVSRLDTNGFYNSSCGLFMPYSVSEKSYGTNVWKTFSVRPTDTNDRIFISQNRGDLKNIEIFVFDSQTNGIGEFVISPIRVGFEKAVSLIGDTSEFSISTSNEWAELAPPLLENIRLGFSESNGQGEPLSSARRKSLKAAGWEDFGIPVNGVPNSQMSDVSTFMPMPPCTESGHSGCYYSPSTWWTSDDWNDPNNWISFPVLIPVEDIFGGLTHIRVNSFAGLAALLSEAGVSLNIPPSPYNPPQVIHKFIDYCENELHNWNSCVCQRCGETREHSWSFVEDDDGCAVCINKNTDKFGKVEKFNTLCRTRCYEPIISFHRQWHHEALVNDPAMAMCCACGCGVFSSGEKGVKLSHQYVDTGEFEPFDADYHGKEEECERCGNIRYIYEPHNMEDGVAEPIEQLGGFDKFLHKTRGVCKDCKAETLTTEEHSIVITQNGCACSGCGLTHEDLSIAGATDLCNNHRCVQSDGWNACGIFMYSDNINTNEEIHSNHYPGPLSLLGAEYYLEKSGGGIMYGDATGSGIATTPQAVRNHFHPCGCALTLIGHNFDYEDDDGLYWCKDYTGENDIAHCGFHVTEDDDGNSLGHDNRRKKDYCPWDSGGHLGGGKVFSWNPNVYRGVLGTGTFPNKVNYPNKKDISEIVRRTDGIVQGRPAPQPVPCPVCKRVGGSTRRISHEIDWDRTGERRDMAHDEESDSLDSIPHYSYINNLEVFFVDTYQTSKISGGYVRWKEYYSYIWKKTSFIILREVIRK